MSSSDSLEDLPPENKDHNTPTSTSSKRSDLRTVRKKTKNTTGITNTGLGRSEELKRPQNIWQKIQNIQRSTLQSSELVSSTPRVSPVTVTENVESPALVNKQLVNINDEVYTTTPIAESAGTRLVSRPDRLPIISGEISDIDLMQAIEVIDSHVTDLANTYGDTPEDIKGANTRYKELIARLNQARLIAASRSLDEF
jgi:hypothetical protein